MKSDTDLLQRAFERGLFRCWWRGRKRGNHGSGYVLVHHDGSRELVRVSKLPERLNELSEAGRRANV